MGAHVEGCYVRPDSKDNAPYFWTGYGTSEKLMEELLQNAKEIERKSTKKARKKFNNACKKYDVPIIKRLPEKSSVSWASNEKRLQV